MVSVQLLKTIIAASMAASKDDSRPSLQRIRIEKAESKLVVVATNGYWLFRGILDEKSHLDGDHAFPLHISIANVKRLSGEVRLSPKRASTLDLNLSDFADTKTEYYPDWKKFIQDKLEPESTPVLGLSGIYMADIISCFQKLGVRAPVLKLSIVNKLSAVTITTSSGSTGVDATAILMPARV